MSWRIQSRFGLVAAILVLGGAVAALTLRSGPRDDLSANLGVSATGRQGPSRGQQAGENQPPDLASMMGVDFRARWQQIDDPSRDGWDTEDFSRRAAVQLNRIGKALATGENPVTADLSDMVTDDFQCGPIVPTDLEPVFRDRLIQVERHQEGYGESIAQNRNPPHATLGAALGELVRLLEGADEIRSKFKILGVDRVGGLTTTRQYVELSGHFEDGLLEQHATWVIGWRDDQASGLRLASLEVVDFEQVRTRLPGGTLFSDCTKSVLGGNACYAGQFLRGYGDWLSRMQNTRESAILGNPGLTVGDVNGDGLDDLYACQEQGLPNRLFLQNPDGTAVEVSGAWGVDLLHDSRSALLVDLDNDGDQDLAVAVLGGVMVASNESNTRFVVQEVLPTGEDLMSLSCADIDLDGDLDIYATVYNAEKFSGQGRAGGLATGGDNFVYHDANVGGRNVLFRNDVGPEQWAFADITEESGLGQNNTRYSFIGSFDDYDNDGDQDLYVANDYGRDNLYLNDGGLFTDIGEQAGAEDAANGMSVSWADFDRDGWMDIYVSNMWSSAGNRIAFQPQFKQDSPEVRRRLQRFARGNTLLRNNGDHTFEHVSAEAGVEMGRWAWGSLFADVNNDGWEDILISNGYVTGDDPDGGDL